MKIEITINNEKFTFEGDDAIVREAVQQFIAAKVQTYQVNVPSIWPLQPGGTAVGGGTFI